MFSEAPPLVIDKVSDNGTLSAQYMGFKKVES